MSKHGWVIEDTENGSFVSNNIGANSGYPLSKARLYETRKAARFHKMYRDRVRKVRVDSGVAVEILPGR